MIANLLSRDDVRGQPFGHAVAGEGVGWNAGTEAGVANAVDLVHLLVEEVAPVRYFGFPDADVAGTRRQDETLLMKAIYEFHPDFIGSKVWWGDPTVNHGLATVEGGDVLIIGNSF